MTDSDDQVEFPNRVYAQTVLKPLFEDTRNNFLPALCRVNRAHCVMLANCNLLSADQASKVASGLIRVEQDLKEKTVAYDPKQEDLFFVIETRLSEAIGPDLAGRLHTGRSRNDMDHTIFRLELLNHIDHLAASAIRLAETLYLKSVREARTIVVAYTHGQPAQPTTFGHYIAGALEVLLRDITRLLAARQDVDRSPMGAAAITTTGFEIDRQKVSDLLGFAAPTENSYVSIAGVDYLTATYSSLKLLLLHLGRTVQDMQFWTSLEVAQLHVPDDLVQISSIMPQKRNPVPIEHMRLLASRGMGEAETIISTMHNTPFTDMNDSEGTMQVTGYRAFETAERVMALLSTFVEKCSIKTDMVAQNIDRSCITITELADTLVRDEGLSFREAHEICGDVARQVLASGGTLQGNGHTFLAKAFSARMSRPVNMTAQAYAQVVSPEHFVAVRERPGGPGPMAMQASSAVYRETIDGFTQHLNAAQNRKTEADEKLRTAFAELHQAEHQGKP
ncbi:argininosuccinate lyase [Hoeflea sp. IMCC20628]|uniref:argininosuccinate lyase n=1 Tax=Hoeflea sp. IMCC20628 TaxID=1620421 RepID=UPI00063AD8CD|nr:argininosuccinate lyase [Hoeflea sp. IMCC20628]AKH99691.1 argininosuccinate lyase [Hoeflea sp. IMCC20628]